MRRMFNDNPGVQHPRSMNVVPGVRLVGSHGLPELDVPIILAVGKNAERAELAHLLSAHFGRAVHSSAVVADTARIGEGTVVLHGAIVQANAVVGRHVLVNTAASIDHDCVVGDFAHVSPRATLCGHVTIGEGTHVGAGAVVIPGVRVGRWCRVGAGAVVVRDLPDHVTAVGNPARILPDRCGEPTPELVCALPAARFRVAGA